MIRFTHSVPGIKDYPDLRRALHYELSTTSGCGACQQKSIYNKYARLVKQRQQQTSRRNIP